MKYVLNSIEMKHADQYTMEHFGIPSAVLMERAALKIAELATDYYNNHNISEKVLVVCGTGNNGGDGFAAARLLNQRNIHADVWLVGNKSHMSVECKRQLDIFLAYKGRIYDTKPHAKYSIIIDALFGVGLNRNVEGDYADALEIMNQMKGYKIAADIPSGISADNGQILGTAFKADTTVTFGFLKRGVLLNPGIEYAGEIVLDDVGITEHSLNNCCTMMIEPEDIRNLLPKRSRFGHKGTYGKVLVIAGSEDMCGAAFLSAKAAYIMGAGLVKIYTHKSNRNVIAGLLPEALISCYEENEPEKLVKELQWADTVIIGPGLSKSKISVNIVKDTLYHCTKLCIIDADALNIISEYPEFVSMSSCQKIVTPHMMEMARLTGQTINDVKEYRFEALEAVLRAFADVCVLKDAVTITGDQSGRLYFNASGNSALSKGGSGDVLTGIIAGLYVQGMVPGQAAALGVYLHGLAGEMMGERKGYYSVMASDLFEGLTELLNEYGDEK